MTEERFIKLTQRDNRSIWLNARFIVTIEPHKDGGALVVPMGDGMDYEVRESAETVVSLCAGEVVAAPRVNDVQRRQQRQQQPAQKKPAEGEGPVVAVAVPDVESPAGPAASDVDSATGNGAAAASAVEQIPAISVSTASAEESPAVVEAPPPAKPAKKTRGRATRAKKSAAASPSADAVAESAAKPVSEKAESAISAPAARKSGGAQSDDEVFAKAAKIGCRSRTRLMNTLKSQFGRNEDAAAALVSAWVEKGALSIDGNGHVEWKKQEEVAE